MEADVVSYLNHKAELKRQQRKEMRELQKRQAMGLAGLLIAGETGPALGLPAIPPELQSTLVDPYTTRGAHEDSLCVVCGDGTSLPPNQILYCERCEVPVHQHCYGLGTLPTGEWLCWPCLMHETELAAKGVPPNEIRPPKWAKDGTAGSEGAGPSSRVKSTPQGSSAPRMRPVAPRDDGGGREPLRRGGQQVGVPCRVPLLHLPASARFSGQVQPWPVPDLLPSPLWAPGGSLLPSEDRPGRQVGVQVLLPSPQ
jgi:hypothetical protein